jgi:hypothetical protein
MTMRRRVEVNLDELDRIIDRGTRAPLSKSEGQKLKTALHAMAEKLVRKRNTEKTSAVLPPDAAPADNPKAGESASVGHGRHGAAAFTGARRVSVAHATLRAGDRCPECQKGKVYRQKDPAMLIRFVGQAPSSRGGLGVVAVGRVATLAAAEPRHPCVSNSVGERGGTALEPAASRSKQLSLCKILRPPKIIPLDENKAKSAKKSTQRTLTESSPPAQSRLHPALHRVQRLDQGHIDFVLLNNSRVLGASNCLSFRQTVLIAAA